MTRFGSFQPIELVALAREWRREGEAENAARLVALARWLDGKTNARVAA